MERIRHAVTGEQQGRGLPQLEEERMHARQGGGGYGQGYGGREGGRGGAQPGELPGLETEEGWERKEGYGGQGYGGRGYGETWEGEEETGVPAGTRGREKMPADMNDFWSDWKFGLTYNSEEWGCVGPVCVPCSAVPSRWWRLVQCRFYPSLCSLSFLHNTL